MTSEADLILGPKKRVEMPAAQITHFAQYPAVQSLCDAFLSEMGWGHDAYTIGQVAAGAVDYALAVNHDPALLVRAARKMRRDSMSIGSPRSCITYGREMLHSPDADSQENRDRYLKGVEDET